MHACLVVVFCVSLRRRLRQRSPTVSREPKSVPLLKERSGTGLGQPERTPHKPGSNPYGEDGPLGRAGSLSVVNSCPQANSQGDQKCVLGKWGR